MAVFHVQALPILLYQILVSYVTTIVLHAFNLAHNVLVVD